MGSVRVTCQMVDLQYGRVGVQRAGVMVPKPKALVTLRLATADLLHGEEQTHVLSGGTELRLELLGEAAQPFIDCWYHYVTDHSAAAEPPLFVVCVTPAEE